MIADSARPGALTLLTAAGAFVVLATANSAIAAVERLQERIVTNRRVVCLLAAPEGIAKFHGHHPDVHIWTAAIDERLDEHGYIVPGLGDAGDRMYGTK